MEWKLARTQAERPKIERECGVRYTELLRLPYFDSACFSIVYPMQNILLGTTKLMITIWKESRGIRPRPQYAFPTKEEYGKKYSFQYSWVSFHGYAIRCQAMGGFTALVSSLLSIS